MAQVFRFSFFYDLLIIFQIKRKRECACGDAYADDEDSDFAPSPKRVKHNGLLASYPLFLTLFSEPIDEPWQPVFPEQNLAQVRSFSCSLTNCL